MIKIIKFPKPKSERICNCGELVKATKFCFVGRTYQAWGYCSCGAAHSFDEFLDERWWENVE
jgi:hypothetical protein